MLRSLVLFAVIAVLHFALSVAGLAVGLRAAFDLQTGFWTAPVRITLAWIAGILLAPLAWLPVRADFGYGEIAAVSALFGAAAVALRHALARGASLEVKRYQPTPYPLAFEQKSGSGVGEQSPHPTEFLWQSFEPREHRRELLSVDASAKRHRGAIAPGSKSKVLRSPSTGQSCRHGGCTRSRNRP